MESKVIELKNIHKYYGSSHVLKGVDLSAMEGDVISILGPSGSGKTTLLRCCNLLEIPYEGVMSIGHQRFEFSGGEVQGMKRIKTKEYVNLRKEVSMVFQHFNLWSHLTALENVIEAPVHVLKKNKKEAKEEGMGFLEKVGLLDFAKKYPNQLSGGQKQRVAIARALAMHPKVILMDEPVSSLDPALVEEVLEVILKLSDEGKTMLIVSHQIHFAREVSNIIIFLFEGLIQDQGKSEEVCQRIRHSAYKKFFTN